MTVVGLVAIVALLAALVLSWGLVGSVLGVSIAGNTRYSMTLVCRRRRPPLADFLEPRTICEMRRSRTVSVGHDIEGYSHRD
jgi:hypothetical protein